MATLQLSIRIGPEDLGPSDVRDLRTHVSDAICLAQDEVFIGLRDEHPAVRAWDAVTTDVLNEVTPKIEALILDAFRARLPWTWEPER